MSQKRHTRSSQFYCFLAVHINGALLLRQRIDVNGGSASNGRFAMQDDIVDAMVAAYRGLFQLHALAILFLL